MCWWQCCLFIYGLIYPSKLKFNYQKAKKMKTKEERETRVRDIKTESKREELLSKILIMLMWLVFVLIPLMCCVPE